MMIFMMSVIGLFAVVVAWVLVSAVTGGAKARAAEAREAKARAAQDGGGLLVADDLQIADGGEELATDIAEGTPLGESVYEADEYDDDDDPDNPDDGVVER